MSKIKLLSEDLINQIAAGEIVEKPASALKEIVENALDAEADNIEIFLQNGGKSRIIVKDNGIGLLKEDLQTAIKRHATSKLSSSNLFDINSYGFRGEALPSIASVSNFTIESNLYGISVNFSEVSDIFPSQIENGTKITIENLFDKLPARLKFLKSDSSELSSCLSIVENFALTNPNISFLVRNEERNLISFHNDTLQSRISAVLGKESFNKAVYFEDKEDVISVSGYLFHPMDSKYSQGYQRIFINNRIVKDKVTSSALKNAYKDLIPSGRFAMAVIFINVDPFHIDVNISPTKSEVRFRDTIYVQKFLTNSFKKAVSKFDRVNLDFDISKIKNFNFSKEPEKVSFDTKHDLPKFAEIDSISKKFSENSSSILNDIFEEKIDKMPDIPETDMPEIPVIEKKPHAIIEEKTEKHFFGKPIAQLFNSYIITQIDDGIMIIDQHAVHEKITQEKMLKQITKENKQFLIKPEMLELSPSESNSIKEYLNDLELCGFSLDLIQNTIMISAIPAIINIDDTIEFIKNLITDDELKPTLETIDFIKRKIADKACHNSIRFGRRLTMEEMTEIIDQMENTLSIHQCNHHRPTFVTIKEDQLKKMFNRS